MLRKEFESQKGIAPSLAITSGKSVANFYLNEGFLKSSFLNYRSLRLMWRKSRGDGKKILLSYRTFRFLWIFGSEIGIIGKVVPKRIRVL
ncbi:hypothetical protein CEXT_577311, partial [Caerostris extrusa]